MSAQTGLAGINADVLSAVNDMMGRVVLFNTSDDRRWSGVLSAIRDDFQFGFELVVQITEENENHLFRKQKDVIDKMEVPFEEIVDFAYFTEEDKKNQFVSKFATDRQYHGNDVNGEEELEEWNGGEEDEEIGGAIEDDTATAGSQSSRRSNHNNAQAGWSAADMFAANEKQVKSTFKEDLTQYTTADIVGTDEDRARAERLAREIESNSSSRFAANLENDDDERDLDKMTRHDEFDNGNNQRGGKRNNYNQPPQQRRNPNITPNGQPVNRRAEGLRGDRRNSGGSSANNSRYSAPAPSHNYQQQQPQGQKGGSHNNRRQNEEYRENDWQMAKGKGQNQGQDHSFRQQQKQMLDARPNAKQSEGEKGQGSGSRVTEMKQWGDKFSLGTPPKEQSPAPGSTQPVSQGNSGSAWNRGPPSSLVAKGANSEPATPAADKEPTGAPKTVTPRKEESPSTSEPGQTEVDGRQEEGDNVSVTGHSDTSSVVTTKSQSFKFNINAPEFKPRVAPTTPTPTTPTGPPPQSLAQVPAQQQFVPQEYQQHSGIIQHGGPLMGMAPHMPPGAVPQGQGQPMMMWQGQPGYQQNQQYPMQQVPGPGVPGQMYGPAATAPITTSQQSAQNQQMGANTSGGSQGDGRQGMPQMRRDGEFREQPFFFPSYNQQGQIVPVQQPYYNSQYQGAIQQQQYQMKMMPQQGPQGNYQPRYQQGPQQVYMVQPGQSSQQQHRYQGGPPQQSQQFSGDQGAPQSHPNSQPTTPGPRGGEMNAQKGQQQQGTPQTQNNNGNNGMHREPEAGSNASLSGSASSQSGQRSGSPHVAAPPQQPPQQHQQGPQHGGPQHNGPQHGGPQHGGPQHSMPAHVGQVQGPMVGMNPHSMPYVVLQQQHPQMHPQMQQYYQQQPVYYNMPQIVPMQQMQMQGNQHGQQSLMGERADNGYAQNNFFDYRNMPNYQQNQQQHQMHGNQIPRQNSIPQQQFGGNQVLKV